MRFESSGRGLPVAFLAVIFFGSTTPFLSAAHPGENGLIAFLRAADGGLTGDLRGEAVKELWVIHPDTREERRLTFFGRDDMGAPSWSPDGGHIAFQLGDQIKIIQVADDCSLLEFKDGCEQDQSCPMSTLAVIDLPDLPEDFEARPTFSPDGERIAVASAEGIRIINRSQALDCAPGDLVCLDGSASLMPNLSGWFLDQPAWSPRGDRLAVRLMPPGANSSVSPRVGLVAIAAGTVEEFANAVRRPAWSPDGTKLMVISRLTIGQSFGYIDVQTHERVGFDPISRLPGNPQYDWADFSPDGARLVFADYTLTANQILRDVWVCSNTEACTSLEISLTNTLADEEGRLIDEFAPAWQPTRGGTTPFGCIVVNSTGDAGDENPGDDACTTGGLIEDEPECTLRAAIEEANSLFESRGIRFNISATPVIDIGIVPLPDILQRVTIDGGSQPGGRVELNGAVTDGPGLKILADSTTITGLVIRDFAREGILVELAGGTRIGGAGGEAGEPPGNVLLRNRDGIRVGGGTTDTRIQGNQILQNGGAGVLVEGGSTDTLIGGNAVNAGNQLEANFVGIQLDDATRTVISGNALNNPTGSIRINGARQTTIGGGTPDIGSAPGNEIRGPVVIAGGATGTRVWGNRISNPLLEHDRGHSVTITGEGTTDTVVGDANPLFRNMIWGSGHGLEGVPTPPAELEGACRFFGGAGVFVDTTGNWVSGNLIGTDGIQALPNVIGVFVEGGGVTVRDNVISGNRCVGALIRGEPSAGAVHFLGNRVGTDAAGLIAIPNRGHGIEIGRGLAFVGGLKGGTACEFPCNLISGNDGAGVFYDTATPTHLTQILGNYIGTDASGLKALGNLGGGIVVERGTPLAIGGASRAGTTICDGGCNLISANSGDGVRALQLDPGRGATDSPIFGLVVLGNFIGLDINAGSLGNSGHGVALGGLANNNRVGGSPVNQANRIGHNGGAGVVIGGGRAGFGQIVYGTGNEIVGNRIYDNGELPIDLSRRAYLPSVANPLPGADPHPALDGPTFNDAFDADPNCPSPGGCNMGPNLVQNYPEIRVAAPRGQNLVRVLGRLQTASVTNRLRIEVFASRRCPGSVGQSERFLGSVDVGGLRDLLFEGTFQLPAPEFRFITATATDQSRNSSEVSPCFEVCAAGNHGICEPDGVDGNNDGIPDNQQSNVVTLPAELDGLAGMTLATDDGTLDRVQRFFATEQVDGIGQGQAPFKSQDGPPAQAAEPGVSVAPDADFPLGLLSFVVEGLAPGASTRVELFLPPGTMVDTYYRFGPTPANPNPHWYEFLFDGTTGAVIEASRVILHLKDGALGDDDLVADGRIVDPGGPALALPHELNFAQFADGLGLFSQLLLLNADPSATARARLTLADDDGIPVLVDLNEAVVSGRHVQTVAGGALARLATDSEGELVVGSVQVHSNVPLAGVLLFGGSFGLAGVGSSASLADGLLAPIEVSAARRVNTGIALMNPGHTEMSTEVTLLNTKGLVVAATRLTLPAGGHLARFVDQLDWDPPPDLADFRGVLRLDLTRGRVAATVLQSRPGEFATLPVASLSAADGMDAVRLQPLENVEGELYFAQFAEGQGLLLSQLLLLNLDDVEATADLILTRSDGGPMSVDLNGALVEGHAVVRVNAGGLAVVTTDGEGADLTVGSATVRSAQRLAGVVLFSGVVGVAGVGSSQAAPQGFLAPVETGADVNTGFAVMNLEDVEIEVGLELLDDSGTSIASGGLMLPPRGHLARFVDQIDWDVEVDFSSFRGQLRAGTTGRVAATVLRTSPGQFATLPVVVR